MGNDEFIVAQFIGIDTLNDIFSDTFEVRLETNECFTDAMQTIELDVIEASGMAGCRLIFAEGVAAADEHILSGIVCGGVRGAFCGDALASKVHIASADVFVICVGRPAEHEQDET